MRRWKVCAFLGVLASCLLTLTFLGAEARATGFPQGDADGDSSVTQADLDIVLGSYNQTGMSWGQGDFNDDGNVDGTDLNIVLSNLGTTSAGAVVPEPALLGLLAIGLFGLFAYGWRKRR
jgi:hypothetical protein